MHKVVFDAELDADSRSKNYLIPHPIGNHIVNYSADFFHCGLQIREAEKIDVTSLTSLIQSTLIGQPRNAAKAVAKMIQSSSKICTEGADFRRWFSVLFSTSGESDV